MVTYGASHGTWSVQDSSVIVLANLKPRNMRGIKSNGMLMAASDASHENVELLTPPEGSVPGERVWFGLEEEKDHQSDPASPNQVSLDNADLSCLSRQLCWCFYMICMHTTAPDFIWSSLSITELFIYYVSACSFFQNSSNCSSDYLPSEFSSNLNYT